MLFRNTDQRSGDYGDIKDKYRPGHADFTFDAKFGLRDYRGGGRSSAARRCAGSPRVPLPRRSWRSRACASWVTSSKWAPCRATIADPSAVSLEQVEATPVRCPDPAVAAAMIALIEEVRKDQDSIGGICELVAVGVPAGLGEPVFDKLKADLAKALLSLPAVMGFEYGAGFGVATARGSANNDPFVRKEDGRIGTSIEPARRHARRHLQRRADRLSRGRQTH